MFVLAVNHDVEDYDTWKQVFDDFHQAELGARFYRVNRNIEHADNITVVHGFDTVEAALQFRDHPDLKEAMGDAGVASAPRFEIYEEVDAGTY